MKITVPSDVREAMENVTRAEGTTIDELAVSAFKHEISRRFLEKIKREGHARRAGKSDEEVAEIVDRAISEVRDESRVR
jgi:hypothetical protein